MFSAVIECEVEDSTVMVSVEIYLFPNHTYEFFTRLILFPTLPNYAGFEFIARCQASATSKSAWQLPNSALPTKSSIMATNHHQV